MGRRNPFIQESVAEYLLSALEPEPRVLAELREETSAMRGAQMQIRPDQGAFFRLILRLMGAQRALEIGVYTGYSSICTAMALGEHGKLIACDISDEWTQVARRYWDKAGVASRIDLRLGPALETLDTIAKGSEPAFDFVFIDADKENYPSYYEHCLQLLRPGGLIVMDNALWGGAVADPSDDAPDTRSIRETNALIAADRRVDASLIPVGDGLMLARKH